MEKRKKTKKIEVENIQEEQKTYIRSNLIKALEDLSTEANNAFFRLPYNRCPDCNKGMNKIMAHFGTNGSKTIGNLKGFTATVGDIVAWYSDTYRGLDFIQTKNNGIFTLENTTFDNPRKEPAVVEKMIIPIKYMKLAEEMAVFLSYPFVGDEDELVTIGNGKYPNDIKEKL